ncbi:14750_t:CDS:2 [Acaulospora morrowiae]|uniref:14750_t:CDS:1 n=1 Tax=Acaulospora morrowiae TaxID=94023 RepID=A0A9N9AW07_9GLOM|nr:14750_t:CDS:2 [Acaulospora morrowiae]
MSTEETATLLPMGSFKENPSNPSNITLKTDEAQVTTTTSTPTTTQTPTSSAAATNTPITTVPVTTSAQTQPKVVAMTSIQQSSGGQTNIIPVQLSGVNPKNDPVSIHPTPLPIQPAPLTPQHGLQQQSPQSQQHTPMRTHSMSATTTPQTTPSGKPPVGSEEWHRQRRENHKEVERRRRDTINAGINELAKIVPGCEKNKGSILNRAVQYIQQLKENEAANIEKWTLEKLLTDQAIQELQTQVDMLKSENNRLRVELDELQGPTKKKQRTD